MVKKSKREIVRKRTLSVDVGDYDKVVAFMASLKDEAKQEQARLRRSKPVKWPAGTVSMAELRKLRKEAKRFMKRMEKLDRLYADLSNVLRVQSLTPADEQEVTIRRNACHEILDYVANAPSYGA